MSSFHSAALIRTSRKAVPLHAATRDGLAAWLAGRSAAERRWIESSGFKAEPATHLVVPGEDLSPAMVLFGIDGEHDIWSWGALPYRLPEGDYQIASELAPSAAARAAIGWGLGAYRFQRYRKADRGPARLVIPKSADRGRVERVVGAVALVRDLVNTPANDLGPDELAAAAKGLAEAHDAKIEEIVGDELLARNWPLVHAVGKGSERAPRLVDMVWGRARDPKVTLVGKGVVFDSGGLDIKSAQAMLMMKKDMGGAAQALGLASMIMSAGLPVRLRVLLPIVENAVSGRSFRPLDVIRSRKGLTVEIGNTDAEGRLVLADALAEASSEAPELLVDFSTLTGAARVALGPDLPAMFTDHEDTAAALAEAAAAEDDPLWRLPLWQPYAKLLKSDVADLSNVSDGPFAGAITAALFLKRFVEPETTWVHFDLYAWNGSDRPGRPKGGEAMTIRALYKVIEERYAK